MDASCIYVGSTLKMHFAPTVRAPLMATVANLTNLRPDLTRLYLCLEGHFIPTLQLASNLRSFANETKSGLVDNCFATAGGSDAD